METTLAMVPMAVPAPVVSNMFYSVPAWSVLTQVTRLCRCHPAPDFTCDAPGDRCLSVGLLVLSDIQSALS